MLILAMSLGIAQPVPAQTPAGDGLRQEMPAPPPEHIPSESGASTPVPSNTVSGSVRGRAVAILTDVSEPLNANVHWRIYRAKPGADGTGEAVATFDEPWPVLVLEPGEYIVVAVYGHAVASTPLKVSASGYVAQVNLNAGAVRVLPQHPDGTPLDEKDVTISIYEAHQDDFGQRRLIVNDAPPASLIALNAGDYHIVSQFGDANSTIRGDIEIEAGKLNQVGVTHSASPVTLKLVDTPGGEALANTAWSILSPGGDVVKESFGAFPTHVLAPGAYSVIARHDGQIFNREFSIEGGMAYEVEIVTR